jgi:hypothetical protein
MSPQPDTRLLRAEKCLLCTLRARSILRGEQACTHVNSSSGCQFSHTRVGTPIIVTDGSCTSTLHCLQKNALALSTGHARFFASPSKLAAHMVFFSLSMPRRADNYFYSWVISILTLAIGPRKKTSVGLLTLEIHTHTKAYGLSICRYVRSVVNSYAENRLAAVIGTYASDRIQVSIYTRKKILCS